MSYFSFEQKRNINKCAVIGCGSTGAAAAHALLQSGAVDALVLINPDKRISDGLASDLYCALPLDANTDIWAGDYSDLSDCALIILALGHIRLHESAHADLVALNLPMIRNAATNIMANYKDSVILVLSQPCEIMTMALLQYSGLPSHKVVGIGTLPQSLHLRRLLSKFLGADAKQIHARILGGSDGNGVFCLDSIRIGASSIQDHMTATGRSYDRAILQSLYEDTVNAISRAESAGGCATFAVSSACALFSQCCLSDTNTVLPLCTSTQGFADLAQSCQSLPCRVCRQGVYALTEAMILPDELDSLRRVSARMHAQMMDAVQIFYPDNEKRVH